MPSCHAPHHNAYENILQGLLLTGSERLATTISTIALSTASTPPTLLTTTTTPTTATLPASVQSSAAATAPSGVTDDPKDLVTTSVISATSTAIVTNAPNAAFPECHPGEMGEFPPFCEPQNGSTKWVGASYYGQCECLRVYLIILLSFCSHMGRCGVLPECHH